MELELKFVAKRDYSFQLKEMGFAEKKHKHLVDTYYISDQKINGISTWLRIREDKLQNKSSFDLHQLHSEYATQETEVSLLSEDVIKMKKIMEVLGLKSQCVVDKERHTYQKNNMEVVLDRVFDLGDFIEIEIEGEENSKNINQINELAQKLGLRIEDHINAGYPDLLMQKLVKL